MESSVFGNRAPGDCRKHARHVILYDGTVATVPTIVDGVLIFGGGISTENPLGIGWNGPSATGNPFRLDYEKIKNGGSGVRIRTSLDTLKRKERLSCRNKICGELGEELYMEITLVQTCEFPQSNNEWYEPILVGFECGCLETCCQRLSKFAKEVNYRRDNFNYPVSATVINIGSDWFVDIEAVNLGQDFRITTSQGFNEPKTIVPYFRQEYTGYQAAFWFPNRTITLLAANPTKKLTAVEISYWKEIPTSGAASSATSNPNSDTYRYETIAESVIVLFDTATSNSNTAYTTLLTLLAGTNAYNKKISSTVSTDHYSYAYTIARTDAGDNAALVDARSDYATNIIQLDRDPRAYYGGKSYYTLFTTSATPPTPDGSDVVTLGPWQPSDAPAIADGCPVPESSICLSC